MSVDNEYRAMEERARQRRLERLNREQWLTTRENLTRDDLLGKPEEHVGFWTAFHDELVSNLSPARRRELGRACAVGLVCLLFFTFVVLVVMSVIWFGGVVL